MKAMKIDFYVEGETIITRATGFMSSTASSRIQLFVKRNVAQGEEEGDAAPEEVTILDMGGVTAIDNHALSNLLALKKYLILINVPAELKLPSQFKVLPSVQEAISELAKLNEPKN